MLENSSDKLQTVDGREKVKPDLNTYVHPYADVQSDNTGSDTKIWQFCVVLRNAIIGENCNICANVFIENDVKIGDNVTIKSGVQIWDGVTIDDYVFVGPNVTFTNDLTPRSKRHFGVYEKTNLHRGCSIGANSTIVAGNTIGTYAMVGAGSVVTRDIPSHTIWYGNPARQKGFITKTGIILDDNMCDKDGVKHTLDE